MKTTYLEVILTCSLTAEELETADNRSHSDTASVCESQAALNCSFSKLLSWPTAAGDTR